MPETLILDGKVIAVEIKKSIRERIAREKLDICLAVVLVGDDPASHVYVNSKEKACAEVGFRSKVVRLPASTSEEELLKLVAELNGDDSVTGILVQIPLPKHIREDRVIDAVSPAKDVDGLHPYNAGRLLTGTPVVSSCTPWGVMKMLEHYRIPIAGKRAVVIGRSNIVGKPMAMLLLAANATVTVCHSKTVNLAEVTREADILVAAIGKPRFVTADMVKEGAVVIDVGINRVEDALQKSGYRLEGDVDYAAVLTKASAITPVPGGVGATTIPMLLSNTLALYEAARK
jgi:methylenetetrahydrofolate dehydrogenase (NADP+)/methenyltetrahydrofolate cyclohydrolase